MSGKRVGNPDSTVAQPSWLGAIISLRDNPLPAMWRRQEARKMLPRSRWLSSPGLLFLTMLLSGLFYLILVRQMLALLAGRAAGGMNPLHASATFWTGVRGLLWFLIGFLTIFTLARLYRAMLNSLSLLELDGRQDRARYDDMLAISTISTRQLIIAHLHDNLRLVMPAVWTTSFLLAGNSLSSILALVETPIPDSAEILTMLLWTPLLSGLSCGMGLIILSCLMLGAGLLRSSSRLQVVGAVFLVLTQLALLFMEITIRTSLQYLKPPQQLLLPALFALIPLATLLGGLALARYSDLFRRGLAGGFFFYLAYVGFLHYLICTAATLGGRYSNSDMSELAIDLGLGSLQIFRVLPFYSLKLLGAMTDLDYQFSGNDFIYSYRWYLVQHQVLPALFLLLQFLFMLFSLHYAARLVEQRRQGRYA